MPEPLPLPRSGPAEASTLLPAPSSTLCPLALLPPSWGAVMLVSVNSVRPPGEWLELCGDSCPSTLFPAWVTAMPLFLSASDTDPISPCPMVYVHLNRVPGTMGARFGVTAVPEHGSFQKPTLECLVSSFRVPFPRSWSVHRSLNWNPAQELPEAVGGGGGLGKETLGWGTDLALGLTPGIPQEPLSSTQSNS